MKTQLFELQGLNDYVNPFLATTGQLIRAQNINPSPYGGLTKREGYAAFLGTTNGSAVRQIFSEDIGGTTFLYAKKGNILQYYNVTAGTGDWATCGNGTFAGTSHIGHTMLENTLILGDGVGSTRHSVNGTSFTDTTLAPIGQFFEQYHQRVYIGGTADTLFYSTVGDATNWSGAGTATSSSIEIPGGGNITAVEKIADKLQIHKSSGNIFKWDEDSLIDVATDAGMIFPQTFSKLQGYGLWLNYEGIYGTGGGAYELLSNPVTDYIRDLTEGDAIGQVFEKKYYLAPQQLIDPITGTVIDNGIIRFDVQKNMYHVWGIEHTPNAMGVYADNTDKLQFLFGNEVGQVYKFDKGLYSDAGEPIEAVAEFLVHCQVPDDPKKWNTFVGFFNPGSRAKIQIGVCNTFDRNNIKLIDLGDTSTGYVSYRFPQGSRSNLLYVKIYERSENPAFTFYGMAIDFDIVDPR